MSLLEDFQFHIDNQKKFGYISNEESVKLLKNFASFQKNGNYDRCPEGIVDFLNLSACQMLSAKLFALDVVKDLPPTKASTILDAASGPECTTARTLSEFNYKKIYALDKKITSAVRDSYKGINRLSGDICCDEVAGRGQGTDFSSYDYVIACKPCDATEHIARQCLRQDKGFIALLCNCNTSTIHHHLFSSTLQWYDYLDKLSCEARIVEVNNFHYLTNLPNINPTFIPYHSVTR